MNKLVSIIAPAYKHERYIEECILSIANQDYPNKELIIIDDKSPDSTADLISKIIQQDEIKKSFLGRITFIEHTKNMGAHYGISEGLEKANGDYLTIINTDDLFEHNRLSEMVRMMEFNQAEICFSKVDVIDNHSNLLRNEEWEYYDSLQQKIFRYPTISMALLTDNVAISTGNMLFTKDLYKQVGPFKEYKYIHDWDFILKSALITEPVYVPNTSYLYRLHDTNSFKELQKDEELCYRESLEVLTNYCRHIKTREFLNLNIPSTKVWEYFISEVIINPDIAHIWLHA